MVRYDRVAAADFDNERAVFSSQYFFNDDQTWWWTADIELTQFTNAHGNSSISPNSNTLYAIQGSRAVVYDNQITHVQRILKDTPLFFVSTYDIAYHQYAPDVFDYLENSLIFSLIYQPIPEVRIGPYVDPSVRNFLTDTSYQHDRNDFHLREGMDVTWQWPDPGSRTD